MPDLDGMGVLGRMREQRHRHAGHRADGAWLDRDGDLGDAGRRRRFRRQAGRRRAPAGVDQERAASRALERRDPPHRRGARRHARPSGTSSPAARRWTRVIRLGERAAASNIPVLIEGESGVGKELLARAIQGACDRRGKPFVTVNCGAIPDNLVESILFGHEKGAFTGATEQACRQVRRGQWRHAVPRRDRRAAARRAGQAAARDPGGRGRSGRRPKRPVKVDVRLISATNQNLIELVKDGPLPRGPLSTGSTSSRSRCRRCARGARTSPISRGASWRASRRRRASASAASPPRRWRCSSSYDWPGNVRQLENAVFRAVVLCRRRRARRRRVPADRGAGRGLRRAACPPLPASRMAAAAARPDARSRARRLRCAIRTRLRLLDENGDVRPLAEIEEQAIRFALQPLSRPHDRDGAQARHRALDALSQDEGSRARREAERGSEAA